MRGFLEQFFGFRGAPEDLHAHRQDRHDAVEQGLLRRPEVVEGGQFHHRHQALAAQHRKHGDGLGRSLDEARIDGKIIAGRAGQGDRAALEGALTGQSLAEVEILVEAAADLEGIAADQAEATVAFLVAVEHAIADLEQRTDG